MSASPVVALHGGAGRHPHDGRVERRRRRLLQILDESYTFLQSHSALETAVFAVQRLEDDPLFNAGTGSMLQRDGRARLSASLMDGPRLRFSGVINIERVKNPILVARALLDESDRVLEGAGALRAARQLGFGPWNPVTPHRLKEWRRHREGTHGTVGAVVLDTTGRLAAATSTGGRGFERAGRVSDSGMPVGNYANGHVAISCTGIGEHIMAEGLAVRIAQRVTDGMSLSRSVRLTFQELARHRHEAAAMSVDRRGHVAWGCTTEILYAVAKTRARRTASF